MYANVDESNFCTHLMYSVVYISIYFDAILKFRMKSALNTKKQGLVLKFFSQDMIFLLVLGILHSKQVVRIQDIEAKLNWY